MPAVVLQNAVISNRAYALTTGSIALSGNSADLLKDDRVKALYLGGEL